MARTKRELANDPNISNQQALVEALLDKPSDTKKLIIPGGAHLSNWVNRDNLQSVLWTWLRGSRYYTKVVLSFARDPEAYAVNETQVMEFDATTEHPIWLSQNEGKLILAGQMANALEEAKNVVSIIAKKDGLYIYTDKEGNFGQGSEDFEPYIEFTLYRTKYGVGA